jgi:small neutral amino acid transporter SnatA (MarC family)
MVAGNQVRTTPREVVVLKGAAKSNVVATLSSKYARLAMLSAAGVLLVASLLLPYWSITLQAPQYPGGLSVDVYAWKLTGDVAEVDGLNHYIGMMKLDDAAKLERAISRFAIPLLAALAVASLWVRGRWRWLAVAPVLLFPIIFLVDLFAWLYYAGHSTPPRRSARRSSRSPRDCWVKATSGSSARSPASAWDSTWR